MTDPLGLSSLWTWGALGGAALLGLWFVYRRIRSAGYRDAVDERKDAEIAAVRRKDELEARTAARSDDDVRRRLLDWVRRDRPGG